MKSVRKSHLFLPHLEKRKGEGGNHQNVSAWIISLPQLCPLLITHKKTRVSCLCQGNVKAAWLMRHESSRAAEKQKVTETKNTPGRKAPRVTQPSLLLPRSPPSLNHGSAKAALRFHSRLTQLKLPVPFSSQQSNHACKQPCEERNV